jgi:hypothetical protein
MVFTTRPLAPSDAMSADLLRDYYAMAGMIFSPIPPLTAVVKALDKLERHLNGDQ